MLRRLGLVAIAASVACHHHGEPGRPLAVAGSRGLAGLTDEGGGGLARLSIGFRRDDTDDVPDDAVTPPSENEGFGEDSTYGGRAYAGWRAPYYSTQPSRQTKYTQSGSLSGVIEGKVTWSGAAPTKLATACGSIDNPSLRVDEKHGLGGAIVFIENITTGRVSQTASLSKPVSVGGAVYKRGCAILPTAQIATPAPIRLDLRTDTATKLTVTTLSITPATPLPKTVMLDLQAGGRGAVSLADGLNHIAGDGLVPAWVLVLATPYFAMTDDAGRFRMDELAPGTYDVTFWHPPIVTIGPTGPTFGQPQVVHRQITVATARTTRADVTLR